MLLKSKREKKLGERERYPLLELCNVRHEHGINTEAIREAKLFNYGFCDRLIENVQMQINNNIWINPLSVVL